MKNAIEQAKQSVQRGELSQRAIILINASMALFFMVNAKIASSMFLELYGFVFFNTGLHIRVSILAEAICSVLLILFFTGLLCVIVYFRGCYEKNNRRISRAT